MELKPKWTNHYVLLANANDNNDPNPSNIIFTIKDENLYAPAVTLLAKDDLEPSTLLSKGFEKSAY